METIVEAREQDMDDLMEMALDLWPEEQPEELTAHFRKTIQSENNKVLLYQINHENVAFAYIGIRVDYVEGSDSSPTGFVECIYVKPQHRNQGIARKLVQEGEQWLKEVGIRQMGSDIYIDNTTSYHFHKQIGFKEAGRLIAIIKDIE
jgi:aminoglycoside 6'-N-acetyltransferase I